jgi:hypothetical protein
MTGQSDRNHNDNSVKISFGRYFVGVFDVLGQSDKLSQWKEVPERNSTSFSDEFLHAIHDTWYTVDKIRTRFKRFCKRIEIPSAPQHLSKEEQAQYCQQTEFEIRTSHFSDTIVVYAANENSSGFLTNAGILGLLAASGNILFTGFLQKIVMRGGITFDISGDFGDGDFYGPALARAHYLEKKIADYPRIVVDDVAVNYLKNNRKNENESLANRGIAEECLKLIGTDSDGLHIVDYLNAEFSRTMSEWHEMRTDAFEFVESELSRFRSASQVPEKEKLVQRYERLREYSLSRSNP